ncbi:MAG: endonuclease/exonuclease/phosphatase family protein [Acidimicrobiia bacterium]
MTSLRILSANLLVDRADAADLRRVIAEADPDVVVTQEMGTRSASVIRETHCHGHLDPRGDLFGMGIASKYPVVVEPLALDERPGWVARLEPDAWPNLKQPLDVLDVHLVNPVDRPWSVSRDTRRRQIAQIRAFLDERDAASVIVGDMNASQLWPEYRLLAELGIDVAVATNTTRRTWAPMTWGPRLLRIDHAFVAGAQPVATSVARIRDTDHCALIVDIEI